ncbi:WxL domain-containing protein [Enterococcus sp. 22-H-5-01]|uniref:WxL domain-containing protein n=1 Tax=Enterococcus sp. 22-H-5-01 TaxID=3418555 RepID=UPI003D07B5DF
MKKISFVLVSATLLGTALLTTTAHAGEKGADYSSNGAVKFIPNSDRNNPVDPDDPNPDNPVVPEDPTNPDGPNPGTDGPLSIDYASSLDFGVNKISNKTQVYYARAQKFKAADGSTSNLIRPNYVQISDNRGNNAGWTLQVKQNGQFTNKDTLNKTLTGSAIKLTSPVVKSNAKNVTAPIATAEINLDPNGAQTTVFSAKKDAGAGTWVNAWGTVSKATEKDENNKDVEADINKEVSLTVPGTTPKDAVNYSTTLTWSLSDTPAN